MGAFESMFKKDVTTPYTEEYLSKFFEITDEEDQNIYDIEKMDYCLSGSYNSEECFITARNELAININYKNWRASNNLPDIKQAFKQETTWAVWFKHEWVFLISNGHGLDFIKYDRRLDDRYRRLTTTFLKLEYVATKKNNTLDNGPVRLLGDLYVNSDNDICVFRYHDNYYYLIKNNNKIEFHKILG